MTDPRPDQWVDANGGRHTTHADMELSDEALDPEDWDLSEIRDGWGFDEEDDDA